MTVYHVAYPSGRSFSLTGRLGIAGGTPTVLRSDGSALVLDPRAVVVDGNGELVYHPRHYLAAMAAEMSDWMREHPEWAAI